MEPSPSLCRRSSPSAIASASVLLVAVASCLALSTRRHLLWDQPLLAPRNGGALSAFHLRQLHSPPPSAAGNPSHGHEIPPPSVTGSLPLPPLAMDSAPSAGSSFAPVVTYHFLLDLDGGISPAKLFASAMEGDDLVDEESEDIAAETVSDDESRTLGWNATAPFPLCPPEMQDFVPCQASFSHKPPDCDARSHCIIATPAAYVRPFKWPQCQSQVRAANIPQVPLLRRVDARNWTKLSGNLILLSQHGPQLSSSTHIYVANLQKLAPGLRFGKKTRVALDVTGGSGSLSVVLEEKGVLTLTIAAKESTNNGIQLVLERGQPGLLQDISSHCLPYPSQAFDLFHFASSETSLSENDGLVLYEADRLVREGGFFIFKKNIEKDKDLTELSRLAASMCWGLIAEDGSSIIWKKHVKKTCYSIQSRFHSQSYSVSVTPNVTWNGSMINCHIEHMKHAEAIVENWPGRLTLPPQRLQHVSTAGIRKAKLEAYTADLNFWKEMIFVYLRYFGQLCALEIRNVLDMNSGYGGFAAAVALKKPAIAWWVMNVIPISSPDRLPVIFDRGLLGVYHDWCKALDTYPRTFDMIHASWLFSIKLRCSISVVALEMDRLLRPGGFVLFRDEKEKVLQFKPLAETLKWKTTILETENGPKGKDIFLHCQKKRRSQKSAKRPRGSN